MVFLQSSSAMSMRLHYSPASPYVRKVMVAAHELQLADQIALIRTNPWQADSNLVQDNPLSKIPTLLTADGQSLYDSYVIIEYLDILAKEGLSVFPQDRHGRLQALRWHAIAQGIIDATASWVLENRRAVGERSQTWMQRQLLAVRRALLSAEEDAGQLINPSPNQLPNIGQIALACALGYLNFRLHNENWQQDAPGLNQWYQNFAKRPSMMATMPSDQ
ncbi:MAG: glutathione S-transferase [Alphaproteobacteria bacterium]|nr:glutathione S-transferase [Alphaproteobacteria bacterium]